MLENNTFDEARISGEGVKNVREIENGRKRIQLERTIQMLDSQFQKEGKKRYVEAEKISEEGSILITYLN